MMVKADERLLKADVYRLKGDLLLALGLRRVSAQIRAEAHQP
jgi:hypothetical protein